VDYYRYNKKECQEFIAAFQTKYGVKLNELDAFGILAVQHAKQRDKAGSRRNGESSLAYVELEPETYRLYSKRSKTNRAAKKSKKKVPRKRA